MDHSFDKARRGITLLALLLILAVLAAAALVAVPVLRSARERADESACALAMESAQRKIDETFVAMGGELSEEDARLAATQSMVEWSDLCPSGGECRLLPKEGGGWTVVCALHCADTKLSARLTAASVLERLQAAVASERLLDRLPPDRLTLTVNGRELTVERAGGAFSTPAFGGPSARYESDGEQVVAFSYADKHHYANWTPAGGWTGDCLS